MHRLQRVPMIRRGNHHGIEAGKFQEFTIIFERLSLFSSGLVTGVLSHHVGGIVEALANNIAHRHHFNIGHTKKRTQVPATHGAHANKTDRKAI